MVRGLKAWAMFAVLALTACGGPRYAARPDAGWTPPASQPGRPGGAPTGSDSGLVTQAITDNTMDRVDEVGANFQQCWAELAAARVELSPMPDRDDGTGCAYTGAGTVSIDRGTVARLSPAQPLLTCEAALAMSIWRRQSVEPAAREIFGQDVVQIDLMGAYSCRNVNGAATGRRSAHARANALDVGGVVLRDGRRITVEADWSDGSDEQRFLRRIRDDACRIYGTVLSPDYNAAHHNHLHLEVREATWTMCR